MKKQSKIKTVVETKLKDNTPVEDWHKERLDKCNLCEFNTKNKKDLKVSDLAMISLNLGKDTCSLCGCGVEDKTSVKSEACALENATNQGEPKWNRIEILTSNTDKIDIENLSTDNVNIDLINSNVNIFLGDIEKNKEYTFDLKIKPKKGTLKNLNLEPSCTCTSTGIKKDKDGNYEVGIKYKSGNSTGKTVKNTVVKYRIGTKDYSFKIIIRGNIK